MSPSGSSASASTARRTQAAIAAELGLSPATISRILKRRGLSLLSSIEPAEPRYKRAAPGEIIHIDIKKLGRFNAIGHRIASHLVVAQVEFKH